jgi:hypothetical protein
VNVREDSQAGMTMHTRYVADFFCLRRRSSPYSRRRRFIATQTIRFVEFKNHDGP